VGEILEEEHDVELLRCLVVQLFSIGNVEDSILIWQVKSSNFDLGCGLDVQFLCGAGVEQTRKYLESAEPAMATKALAYLESCIQSGDFRGWTPLDSVVSHRQYLGLKP